MVKKISEICLWCLAVAKKTEKYFPEILLVVFPGARPFQVFRDFYFHFKQT